MHYILALLLALLGGCYTYAPSPAAMDSRHWMEWLTSGTAQVFTVCEDSTSSGSGVVIHREGNVAYFATAFHVTDPGCSYYVNGEELELVAYDVFYDQAILVGSVAGRVTEETDGVFLGQRVTVAGFPVQPFTGTTGFQITQGNLAAMLGSRYKVTAPAYYGSSGGPCFDKDGELVGLLVSLIAIGGAPVEWHVTPAWRTYELLDEALHR